MDSRIRRMSLHREDFLQKAHLLMFDKDFDFPQAEDIAVSQGASPKHEGFVGAGPSD